MDNVIWKAGWQFILFNITSFRSAKVISDDGRIGGRTLKHIIFISARIKTILGELCNSLATDNDGVENRNCKFVKKLYDIKAQPNRLYILFEHKQLSLETLRERFKALTAKQSSIQRQIDDLPNRMTITPRTVTSEDIESFCRRVLELDELRTALPKSTSNRSLTRSS